MAEAIESLKDDLKAEAAQLEPDEVRIAVEAQDWQSLYNSVSVMLWGLALHKVNVQGWTLDPLDLFQEASEKLLSALPKYDPGRARLSTYAHMVAEHAMIAWLRREVRAAGLAFVPQDEERQLGDAYGSDGFGQLQAADRLDALALHAGALDANPAGHIERFMDLSAQMERLPERQRQAVLHRLSGYDEAEVAESMGISQPAVSKLLRKAVINLGLSEQYSSESSE